MSKRSSKKSETVTVNVDATSAYLADMLAAFDARASYEAAKNAENSNIQETIKDLRKSVNHSAIAQVFMSANVSADFINRAERNNARFNVYSAQKVVNVARAAKSASALNHYTKAILLSLREFAKAKVSFTHKDAIAACSIDSKVAASKEALIKRYEKIVSASTASTQASSSVNALLQFACVTEKRDSANNVCYELNENEITQALLERVA